MADAVVRHRIHKNGELLMARYNPGFVEDAIVNQEFQKVAESLDTPDKFLMLIMQYESPSKPR